MNGVDRLGLALWGVGEHAQRNLLPALDRCERLALRGLYTHSKAEAERLASVRGLRAYATPEEMLDDQDVDVVFVGTWNGSHASCGRQVLEAGRHLWCDKPLAATWTDWQDLVATARTRGLAAFEGMMFPFHPQFQTLRRMISDGQVGTVRHVSARFAFPHLRHSNFRYRPADGGGALLDAAGYPLAAARLLLGRLVEVRALLETEPGFEVDTSGSALLRAESGAHALLEWGFGFSYRNEIEVWGDGGLLMAERAFSKPSDLQTVLRLRLQSGESREVGILACNHFTVMLDAFAKAIQEDDMEHFRQEAWEQGQLLERVRVASASRT